MEKFLTWFLVTSIIKEAFFDDKECLQDYDRTVMPSVNRACYLTVTVYLPGVTEEYRIQLPKEKMFLLFEVRRCLCRCILGALFWQGK